MLLWKIQQMQFGEKKIMMELIKDKLTLKNNNYKL